jgi:hypothetical protein
VSTTSHNYSPRCFFPTRNDWLSTVTVPGHAHPPDERHAPGRQGLALGRHDEARGQLLQPQTPAMLCRRLAIEPRGDVLRVDRLWQARQLPPQVPPWQAIRTEPWKYIHYPENADRDELYDLRADPKEERNRARDPAADKVLATMKQELQRLLNEAR